MHGGLKMSKENRRKVYDRLVAEGNLDKDDGALVKEFGKPTIPEPVKPKGGKK